MVAELPDVAAWIRLSCDFSMSTEDGSTTGNRGAGTPISETEGAHWTVYPKQGEL